MVLHFVFRALEIMFFVGLAGSLAVAILAFAGDIPEFFNKNSVSIGQMLGTIQKCLMAAIDAAFLARSERSRVLYYQLLKLRRFAG